MINLTLKHNIMVKMSNVMSYYGTIATRDNGDRSIIRDDMLAIIREKKGLNVDIGPNPRVLTADEAVEQWDDVIDEIEPS